MKRGRARVRVRRRLRRGVYLLPSLFTTGNMLLGFWALVLGLRGDFKVAALLVFAAGVLDTLDGRLARMTHTESDFGRELDSLADLFTFGSVPAILTYLWGLVELGRAGWLIPFFYMACTAIRLARFNVRVRVVDSRYFVGLPSPAAAGTICSILFYAPVQSWKPWTTVFLAVALLVAGALMVSTFRFRSFKQIDLHERLSYRSLLPIVAVLLVVLYEPPAFFLIVGVLYTLSGPTGWLMSRWRGTDDRLIGDRKESP